jgi:hypothetical protein
MLKPEVSIPIALAVGTMVYAIHSNATPTLADMRAVPPGDDNLDASRRMATWTAAGAVSFTALVAKDPNIFIVGGGMVIVMDFLSRWSSNMDPTTGKPAGMVGNIGGAFSVDNTVPDYYDSSALV